MGVMTDDGSGGGIESHGRHYELSPEAVVIEGQTQRGRSCRVIDNTGTVPRSELEALLEQLLNENRFGLAGLSSSGEGTIRLGEPMFTHIQFGDELYRLLLFPYEAVIDHF